MCLVHTNLAWLQRIHVSDKIKKLQTFTGSHFLCHSLYCNIVQYCECFHRVWLRWIKLFRLLEYTISYTCCRKLLCRIYQNSIASTWTAYCFKRWITRHLNTRISRCFWTNGSSKQRQKGDSSYIHCQSIYFTVHFHYWLHGYKKSGQDWMHLDKKSYSFGFRSNSPDHTKHFNNFVALNKCLQS